ncbi:hypothetical protein [Mycobacterium sp. E740]|nr:hypothetical protein [Mycobacterium sp. E740]
MGRQAALLRANLIGEGGRGSPTVVQASFAAAITDFVRMRVGQRRASS